MTDMAADPSEITISVQAMLIALLNIPPGR
jgi:hypothetical protein